MRRILRGGSAAARSVGVVLLMAVHLWLARALGPDGYGSFVLAVVVSGAVVLAANAGMGSAIAYRIAREPARCRSILLAGVAVSIATSMVALAVTAPLLLAADPFPTVTRAWLAFALAAVPARLLQEAFAGAAVGVGRWERSVGLALAHPLFFACALIGADDGGTISEAAAAAAWVVAQAATALAACIATSRVLPLGAVSARDAVSAVGPLLRLGVQQTVNMAAWWLIVRTDRSIVGAVAGAGAAGRFAIGAALIDVVLTIPSVIAVAVFHRLVGEAPQAAASTLQSVSRGTTLLTTAVLLVAAPPLALVGVELLGPVYADLPLVLIALTPGAIALVPTTLVGTYFFAVLGRPWLNLVPTAAALIVMVVAVPYLTAIWGIVGAALGTSLSQLTAGTTAVILFSARSTTRWQRTVMPDIGDGLRVLRMLSRSDAYGT